MDKEGTPTAAELDWIRANREFFEYQLASWNAAERQRELDRDSIGSQINTGLDLIREALFDLAYHDEPYDDFSRDEVEGQVYSLLQEVIGERLRRRAKARPGRFPITFTEVTSRGVKFLRERSNTTQDGLARMMHRCGFVAWKRITVAEVESGKRRLAIEEMVALAVIFAVPVGFLLCSLETDEVLQLNERIQLTAAQTQEFVVGSPIDDSWLGIRLQPMYSDRAFDESDEDTWRPASTDEWWVDVHDHEGRQVLRQWRVLAGRDE